MQYVKILSGLKPEIFIRMFLLNIILDLQYWERIIWKKVESGNFGKEITFPDKVSYLVLMKFRAN